VLAISWGCVGGDFAERLYKAGQRAERAGDTLHAYLLYVRAAALDPRNPQYAARKTALQAAAAMLSEERMEPDAANEEVTGAIETEELSGREIQEARQALPPPRLAGSPEKRSFDIKGDARTIVEKVIDAYGLLVVFEADYQPPPPFSFRVQDVGFEDALRMLEAAANSFLVPVNQRLALVVRDTPQKRAEMAPAMSIAVPIPERMSVQDAQEILTAVQQTLEIRRVSVDPVKRVVYLRDQAAKVNAARLIFANLSRLRAQVEVEVDFLEVAKNSSLGYGLSLPTSVPVVNFGTFMHNKPSIPAGFTRFLTFGGGATFFGLGVADASAFATLSRNSASTVLQSQVVALDGQATTLHVGDRYPIITNGYYGNATGTGQVFAPPPTINFEDLGLVLKVTPSVHEQGGVTLDLDAEFKVLGTGSPNGIPVISSRKFTGKVRLNSGEWAVIAGLAGTNYTASYTGIAGLSSIPLLGHLFRQNTVQKDSTETLILLKPRIVTLPPWESVTQTIWVGTETKPITMY